MPEANCKLPAIEKSKPKGQKGAQLRTYSDDMEEDLAPLNCSQDISQFMPRQQLFQDLDIELEYPDRVAYLTKLRAIANSDPSRICLYQEHLWDKARKDSECPKGLLITRKTNKANRSEKYASDCFTIHNSFKVKDLATFFSIMAGGSVLNELLNPGTPGPSDRTNLRDDFREPNLTAMVIKLLAEVDKLRQQRVRDAKVIKDLSDKIDSVTNTQDLVLTSVNGLRARMPKCDISQKITCIESILRENCHNVKPEHTHLMDNNAGEQVEVVNDAPTGMLPEDYAELIVIDSSEDSCFHEGESETQSTDNTANIGVESSEYVESSKRTVAKDQQDIVLHTTGYARSGPSRSKYSHILCGCGKIKRRAHKKMVKNVIRSM